MDLFKIYDVLFEYHKKVPYLRFGQLMENFFEWHHNYYGTDCFYINNDDFITRFKTYMNFLLGEEI